MVYFRLFGNLGNLLFQYGTAVSLGGGRAVGVASDPKTLAQLKLKGGDCPCVSIEDAPASTASGC